MESSRRQEEERVEARAVLNSTPPEPLCHVSHPDGPQMPHSGVADARRFKYLCHMSTSLLPLRSRTVESEKSTRVWSALSFMVSCASSRHRNNLNVRRLLPSHTWSSHHTRHNHLSKQQAIPGLTQRMMRVATCETTTSCAGPNLILPRGSITRQH